MTDLAKTIVPKSDQLNADDLIAGPRTITITEVRGVDGDQPIAIHFEGDDRKPYKPCKSMRRVMVHAWGSDGNTYPGRRMTIFCDPEVQFGGIKVGGIRISHMSHIDRPMVIPLTVTRAKRSPYEVKPLNAEVRSAPVRGQDQARDDDRREEPKGREAPKAGAPGMTLAQRADAYEQRIRDAPSSIKLNAIHAAAAQLQTDLEASDPERGVELEQLWQEHFDAAIAKERAGE